MATGYRKEQYPRDAEGNPLELQFSAQEDTRGNNDGQHKDRMCDARAEEQIT